MGRDPDPRPRKTLGDIHSPSICVPAPPTRKDPAVIDDEGDLAASRSDTGWIPTVDARASDALQLRAREEAREAGLHALRKIGPVWHTTRDMPEGPDDQSP
jgi:hypothetical protein